MAQKNDYNAQMKQELLNVIDSLELPDLHKAFLRGRWLDQIVWMEGRSRRNQQRYYLLRVVTIVGGVLIPPLVQLQQSENGAGLFQWLALAVGLAVAISAALDEFFHYGERWRHYRRTVEVLKAEGWKFFQLSGPYAQHDTHLAAYPFFVARVEAVIEQEVNVFITQTTQEKQEKGAGETETT